MKNSSTPLNYNKIGSSYQFRNFEEDFNTIKTLVNTNDKYYVTKRNEAFDKIEHNIKLLIKENEAHANLYESFLIDVNNKIEKQFNKFNDTILKIIEVLINNQKSTFETIQENSNEKIENEFKKLKNLFNNSIEKLNDSINVKLNQHLKNEENNNVPKNNLYELNNKNINLNIINTNYENQKNNNHNLNDKKEAMETYKNGIQLSSKDFPPLQKDIKTIDYDQISPRESNKKILKFYYSSNSEFYFNSLSSFFKNHTPLTIDSELIELSLENYKNKISQDVFNMEVNDYPVLFVIFCGSSRVDYPWYKEDIERIQKKNKVILLTLVMGEKSKPIVIHGFNGKKIFFQTKSEHPNNNSFNLYDNEFNKRSLIDLCKELI